MITRFDVPVTPESAASRTCLITLDAKQAGKPIAGNRHDGFEVAEAGNRLTVRILRHSQRKRGAPVRLNLRSTAPVFDPTRYPVRPRAFHLIGKETERGWEQNDDISTLMPALVRYGSDTGIADEQLRKRLIPIPLAFLEFETGLSRHTIVRARRGQAVHPRSLRTANDCSESSEEKQYEVVYFHIS